MSRPEATADWWHEQALRAPVTVQCALCSFVAVGPVDEARAVVAEHPCPGRDGPRIAPVDQPFGRLRSGPKQRSLEAA
jgi:hypothetical protein